jgi:cytochrome c biogenesis protein CcmG/thiol:disulfide interchange protein DsbE
MEVLVMEIKHLASNTVEPQVQEESISSAELIRRRSRKRNKIVFAVTSVLSVGLLVLIWTQLVTPAAPQATTGSSSSVSSGGPLVGKPAPDFTLRTLNGGAKSMHLADLKGKPVVINFWASWCGPCNDEAPVLSQSWPTLQSQGVVMIGIDASYSTQDALNFMKQYGITYPNVEDTTNRDTAIAYGVTAMPETFFINRQGVIVAHYSAPFTSAQAFKSEVAKIVGPNS